MIAVNIPDVAVMLPASIRPITEKSAIAQAIPRIILIAKSVFQTVGFISAFEM